MREHKQFVHLVARGSEIRKESDVQWGQYYHAKKIFDIIWPEHAGQLKSINDWLYYLGGGWPTENSKGRMERALETVGSAYSFLTIVGQGNIVEEFLDKYGITISISEEKLEELKFKIGKNEMLAIKKHWESIFPKTKMPNQSEEVFSQLLDFAGDLQAEICRLADEVKIGLAREAELACDVKKVNFMQCVTLKKLDVPKKEKRFKKAVVRIHTEKIQNLEDALEAISK